MLKFEKFTLPNGLKVIVHTDKTTPIVAVNMLYNVGARDEHPDKTGFAHLFEHLMFGGSKNIPEYDSPLQMAGGENNAFTSNDITNYYITLPKQNLETAFWLESDRMNELAFTEKSLEVQRDVVIEEYKQRYLNSPYGDVPLITRPLAYKVHPYSWPTIGKSLKHIEEATMEDVKAFFFKFYAPDNAILSVAGDVSVTEIEALATKWFGDIPNRNVPKRIYAKEPTQTQEQRMEVSRNVPYNSLHMLFHMCDRLHADYYVTDLVSDVLSNGSSSRLYRRLVQEKRIFSHVDAYIYGSADEGIFEVSGQPAEGVAIADAEKAVWDELQLIVKEGVSDYELEKVQNKVESTIVFGDTSILNKAMNLARFELLGNANWLNDEVGKYRAVRPEDIRRVAGTIFTRENVSVLHYLAEKQPELNKI